MDTAAAPRSADDYVHVEASTSTRDAIEINRSAQKPKNPDNRAYTVTSSKESVTMSSSKPSSIANAKAKATMTSGRGPEDAEGGEKNHNCAKRTNGKKMLVKKCSYKDYSHIQARGSLLSFGTADSTNKQHKFPAKLHAVLSNPAFEDVMCWMPHGRSWKITQPGVFEEKLLPILFGHCHLNSFMRQVNGWGFHRIKRGRDYNCYYHELFLRGMPHLVDQMRRESLREKKRRCSRDGEGARDCTPDLYKISKENPLPENPPSPLELEPPTFKAAHVDLGVSVGSEKPIQPGVAALQIVAPRQLQSGTPLGISVGSETLIRPGVAAFQTVAPRQLQSGTPLSPVHSDEIRESAHGTFRWDHSAVDSIVVMPSRTRYSQNMGLHGIIPYPTAEERPTTMENQLIGLLAQEQQRLSSWHSIPVAASSAVNAALGFRAEAPQSLSNNEVVASSTVDAGLGFTTEAPRWLDPHFALRRSILGGTNPSEIPSTRVLHGEAEYCVLKTDRWPRS